MCNRSKGPSERPREGGVSMKSHKRVCAMHAPRTHAISRNVDAFS